jgi:L-lactate dehydrogenase (cytochrome)
MLYAAAVGGAEGVGHAIALLRGELDRDLALLGIDTPASLGRDSVFRLADGLLPGLG